MEKDSFENQLRNKVLQAESTLNQASNKERVWNAIQKKQDPSRKLYYAAAAILLVVGMLSVLYDKKDKINTPIVKAKQHKKPQGSDLKKPQILQQRIIMQPAASSINTERTEQTAVAVTQMENAERKLENNISTEVLPNVVQQKTDEPTASTVTNTIEKPTSQLAQLAIAPEFTVQFKRGKPVDEVEKQTKEAIARLKKFKLSKDTSVLANTNEKQKGFFKIKF